MGAEQSTAIERAADDVRHFSHELHTVATLPWPAFVSKIAELNTRFEQIPEAFQCISMRRCAQLRDDNGKHLLFALKKGTSDTLLWRAAVRICCLKVRDAPGTTQVQVVSRRIMDLRQVHSSCKAFHKHYIRFNSSSVRRALSIS